MNDNFNDQKEKLVSLSHEINLLRQQVNYLLRNGKALGLLDLDVLMNRTHTIYDTLCAINLGDDGNEDELDFDPEALAGLFGASLQEESQAEAETETPDDETPQPAVEETPAPEKPMPVEEVPAVEMEEAPVVEEVPAVEEAPVVEETPVAEETPQVEENQIVEPLVEAEEHPQETPAPVAVQEPESEPNSAPAGDEFGFFFRFEDMAPVEAEEEKNEEKSEEKPEEPVAEEQPAPPVYVDDKWVHFVKEVPEDQIPERDFVDAGEMVRDNPYEMPKMEDAGFELTTHETLGEKMIQGDHSLAAKLQQNRIPDLKSVIGINDKFLFVNELFGGSMEKYNKSIENLNDLKTLNGAMIYLNELKIELQWNSSNEAYNKLTDLVRRKFE